MKMNRWIAGLLSGAMLLSCTAALAAEAEPAFYLNEQFDNYDTNSLPDSIQMAGSRPLVVDDGSGNKALQTPEEYSKVFFAVSSLPGRFVLSMDLKRGGEAPVSGNLQFANGATVNGTKVLQIQDNEITTVDRRYVCGLSEYAVHLDLVINNQRNIYDLYVNGKRKLKSWKLSGTLGGGLAIEVSKGSVKMDNVQIHDGSGLDVQAPKLPYNSVSQAKIDYDYRTNADMVLVDTNYLQDVVNSMEGQYHNFVKAEKGNKMTLNRLEQRNNPNRDNAYIIIEKTNQNDIHGDFNVGTPDAGYFPYYYGEGRVRVDKMGAPVRPAFLRDSSTGANQDIEMIRVDPTGQIITGGGKVVRRLSEGEWFSFRWVLELSTNTAQVFVDDQLVDTFSYNANFNHPTMMRIWVDTGSNCTATLDQIKLIAMRHPFDINNPDYHPFWFSGDESIDEFFTDKTAFYAFSENVASHGEKHIRVDKAVWQDKVLYVSPKALNVGYDFNLAVDPGTKTAKDDTLTLTADSPKVTYQGQEYELSLPCIWERDTVYVPVETFAKVVLGHDVKADGNGLVITAVTPFGMDTTELLPEYQIQEANRPSTANYYKYTTPIKAVNWYMSFERPDVETLRADYNAATNNGTMHPHIIANAADIEKIRTNMNTDPVLKGIVDDVIAKADGLLTMDTDLASLNYNIYDLQRILDLARTALDRIRRLCFAYQITKDQRYADAAYAVMKKVCDYPDWNPSHMIDSGELLAAVGVAYDWIHDTMTQEQRDYIWQRIKKVGLDLVHDAYRDISYTRSTRAGAGDFVGSKSNFNTIVNGGAMVAALAFMEHDPDYCLDILRCAMRSEERTMLMYRPDGIWCESSSYWDYAANYLSRGVGSLIKSTGHHYGLMDAQGVEKTGTWMRSINSYAGVNNFHDGGQGVIYSPWYGWFGEVTNNPVLNAVAINQITNKQRSGEPEDAVWYIPNNTASEDDLPMDVFAEGFDTVTSRASYTDDTALFFSTHGGQVTCYHSQVDVGTYVFDINGQRWVDDLGSEDYNIRAEMNFQVYRDRAEAHNLIVFNPDTSAGQDADGKATVTRYISKDRGTIASYDMQDCYKNYVNKYERGYLVSDDRRTLTVRDEFNPKSSVPGDWFVTTHAEVEQVDDRTLLLRRGGETVKMEISTNLEGAKLATGPCEPLPTSPHPVAPSGGTQNPNTGYTRIQLQFNTQPGQDAAITVRYSAEGEPVADFSTVDIPIADWTIPDGEFVKRESFSPIIYVNGVPLSTIKANNPNDKISVVDGEPLPVITAETTVPGQRVEIIPGEPENAYTIVRVYSSDGSYYRDARVVYEVVQSANLSAFTELEIKNITVSAEPEKENHKENMLDGNFSSRWSSANESGSWAVFDLGEPKQIDGVAMAFWQGNTRHYFYELLVSNDGANWTSVAEGQSSAVSEGYETVEFAPVEAQYLKILGGGNTSNGHTNILEFRILQKNQ